MKFYCWFDRNGKFHADEQYIEDNPLEAFYIDIIEAENKETAEALSKQIIKERFKKI